MGKEHSAHPCVADHSTNQHVQMDAFARYSLKTLRFAKPLHVIPYFRIALKRRTSAFQICVWTTIGVSLMSLVRPASFTTPANQIIPATKVWFVSPRILQRKSASRSSRGAVNHSVRLELIAVPAQVRNVFHTIKSAMLAFASSQASSKRVVTSAI